MPVTLQGTVTRIEMVNPHGWIYIDVKGPDGKIVNWAIETGGPNALARRGVKKGFLPIGQVVIVTGYRAKDMSFTAAGDSREVSGRPQLLGGRLGWRRISRRHAMIASISSVASLRQRSWLLAVSSFAPVAGQAPASRPPYTPPKTFRGQPDLQGVWQAQNTAAWNIEDHSGATGIPAGKSVVEGGPLPYLPEALVKRNRNFANRKKEDPETKCWLPGVPRITYMPFPFQILQFDRYVVINYEYLNTTRYIYMDGTPSPDPDVIDFFMGSSNGRWEGNSLVVDVTNNNDRTWFDRAGNHHSDAMRLVERYTPIGPDHLQYEVTVTDPKTFSRSWKMSMPLYRQGRASRRAA